jgi:hypothetical protein
VRQLCAGIAVETFDILGVDFEVPAGLASGALEFCVKAQAAKEL